LSLDLPLLEDAKRKVKNRAAAEATKAKKDKEMERRRKRLLKQPSDDDEDDEDDDDEDDDKETGRWPMMALCPRSMKRMRRSASSRPLTGTSWRRRRKKMTHPSSRRAPSRSTP
jgi:hypothetical protein